MTERRNRNYYGLELMVDREPCETDCSTCDLFCDLMPERVSRIRRELDDERRDDN